MDAVDVDERIRQLLARGESATARALLVEEFQGRVGALCRGMVGNAALAEDLKQDTFERAFESLDTFRGESSVSTWLLRIARNRCIDHLRAGESRFVSPAGDVVSEVATDDSRSLADVIASLQRAEHALAVLEPEDRALVLLRHVHDVSYAELSETFGVKEGALRMRVSRALETMRVSLEREDARIPSGASTSMPPKRRGILVPRAVLWVTLATLVSSFVGLWYGVIVPQQQAAASLAAQIEALQQEQAQAEQALAAAQSSNASEAEIQRLRDQLATAQQAAAAGASGTAPATRPSTAAHVRDGGTPTSTTGGGGCAGPLCGLMRN